MLDVFGTPIQQHKQGNGPGYFVITADFDNDGNDEFIVALWGASPDEPWPNLDAECQVVWYYKPVDLACGLLLNGRLQLNQKDDLPEETFMGMG